MNFSVLISVYKKDNSFYLDESLQSIWDQQTKKPGQIVLVKDGPLSEELDICISLWKQKLGDILTIVELPGNAGLGAALNAGLLQCRYELVARMDADDISLPERFEKQTAFMENNPDIVLLSGYISEFKNNPGDINSIRKVPLDNKEIIKYLKRRNAFNHMAVMFKKSAVLAAGGYNAGMTYFEDFDLWIRLVQAQFKAANIPENLVHVRIGNNMLNRRRGVLYMKKELNFFNLQRKRKFISECEYVTLVLLRIPLRLVPRKIFSCLYYLLRSSKN